MTTTKITFLLSILLLSLSACKDSNYKGENYVSFDSIEELEKRVVQNIQTKNEADFFKLLDNEALILDVLFASNDSKSNQLKSRLNTKEGQSFWEREKLGKKVRIQTFFSSVLPKFNTQELKSKGFELLESKDYAEGSPAKSQKYNLVLTDEKKDTYHYNITVIFWEQKYHLIEAASHLQKQ